MGPQQQRPCLLFRQPGGRRLLRPMPTAARLAPAPPPVSSAAFGARAAAMAFGSPALLPRLARNSRIPLLYCGNEATRPTESAMAAVRSGKADAQVGPEMQEFAQPRSARHPSPHLKTPTPPPPPTHPCSDSTASRALRTLIRVASSAALARPASRRARPAALALGGEGLSGKRPPPPRSSEYLCVPVGDRLASIKPGRLSM